MVWALVFVAEGMWEGITQHGTRVKSDVDATPITFSGRDIKS